MSVVMGNVLVMVDLGVAATVVMAVGMRLPGGIVEVASTSGVGRHGETQDDGEAEEKGDGALAGHC